MGFLSFFFPIFVEIMLGNFADTIGVDSWVRQKWEELRQSKYKRLLELADKNQELAKISREVFDEVLPELSQETDGVTSEIRNAIIEDVLITLTQAHLNSDIFLDHELDTERLTNYLLEPQKLRLQDRPRWQRDIHNRLISFIADHLLTHADRQTDWERTQVRRLLKSINLIEENVDILVERPDNEARTFEQEYKAYIKDRFNQLDHFGIPEVNKRHSQFNLFNAFVFPSLRVSQQRHWRTRAERERGLWETELPPLRNARDAFIVSHRVLLRGSAGLGKTTLLRWLAVSLAQERLGQGLESLNGERYVPFVIQLRDCVKDSFPAATHLVEHICDEQLEPPERWETKILKEHRGWILIDGLDEIPEHKRVEMLRGIKSLITAYRHCRFLMSSRPEPIKEQKWPELDEFLEGEEFTELDIEPLQLPQVTQLVTLWYQVAATIEKHPVHKRKLQQLTPKLIGQINNRLVLRRLAETPLLCAMLCLLYSENENLPTERISLFEKCISMLFSRDEARDIESSIPINGEHLRGYLQELAYGMNLAETLETKRNNVIKTLTRLIKPHKVSADAVLDHIIERIGLLQAPSSTEVAFSHRSFQEFFTAEYLIDRDFLKLRFVQQYALNSFWQETLILSIGLAPLKDAKTILSGLLKFALTQYESQAKSLRLLILASVRMVHTRRDLTPLFNKIFDTIKPYFPPRSDEEVYALIPAGERAVPLLSLEALPTFNIQELEEGDPFDDKNVVKMLIACIRTLAGIGGQSALEVLVKYAPLMDHSYSIAKELSMAWDSFDREQFVLKVLSATQTLAIWRDPRDLPLHFLTNIRYLYTDNIEDLSFLAESWASNLESLNPALSPVKDLNIVGSLTNLRKLLLFNTQVSDVSALATLINLQELHLADTQVSDVSALATLTNLQELDLENTQVSDVSVLATLINIQTLHLSNTQVSNVSVLATLTNLQTLHLSNTQVSDVSALASLINLQKLDLADTQVSDISALASLINLQELILSVTQVSDVSVLVSLTNLQELDLSGTQVSNVSTLASVNNLRKLYLCDTEVSDISAFTSLTNLQELDLSGTQVSDVSALTSLINLQKLYLSGTQVYDVSMLRDRLPHLNIYGVHNEGNEDLPDLELE